MKKHPTLRDYLAVSLYWLAPSFFWGAVLTVVVQSRVQMMSTQDLSSLALNATQLNIEIEKLSATRLGWMLGIGALISTISQILSGTLSDSSTHRFGRRRPFLIAGVVLGSLAIACFPLAPSYITLVGVFIAIQLFLNMASGPYQALLPDLIEAHHHGRAAAFLGLFQLLGRTGGMVLGALLLMKWPREGIWIFTFVSIFLLNALMIVSASLARETPLSLSTQESVTTRLRESLRYDLRGHRSFAWVIASRFMVSLGLYTVMPFLQYYLQNTFGLSEKDALWQMAILGLTVNIAGLLATFPAGMAGDRFSKKAVVYFTGAVCVLGGLGFAVAGNLMGAFFAAAVFGLGYGAFCAIDYALVYNVLPAENPAKYMGLWSFADNVPQIIAPVLGGLISNAALAAFGPSHAYRITIFSAVLWFLFGTLLIRFVKERGRDDARNTAA